MLEPKATASRLDSTRNRPTGSAWRRPLSGRNRRAAAYVESDAAFAAAHLSLRNVSCRDGYHNLYMNAIMSPIVVRV